MGGSRGPGSGELENFPPRNAYTQIVGRSSSLGPARPCKGGSEYGIVGRGILTIQESHPMRSTRKAQILRVHQPAYFGK